eukprot:gene11293-4104_t
MLKTLIFCCLISLIASQLPRCSKTYYGNVGETCDGADRQCKIFLTCQNGRCQNGFIGSTCSSHNDCYLSSPKLEGIKCINGRCTKKKYPGYHCLLKDECHSHQCKNRVCVGKTIGENCDPTGPVECGKGLYCSYNTKTCAKQKLIKENCEDVEPKELSERQEGENFMVICPGGTKCRRNPSQTESTCQEIYNSKLGEECSYTDECEPTLRCRNEKCVEAVPRLSPCGNTNCTSTNSERCMCDSEGNPGTCQAVLAPGCDWNKFQREWKGCWRDNNCHYDRNWIFSILTDVFQTDTCMGEACPEIGREYVCCMFRGMDKFSYTNANPIPLQCTDTTILTSLVLIVLLLVCSFLFEKRTKF